MKVEIAYFEMKNFFTPLKSFLPPFCTNELWKIQDFQYRALSIQNASDAKKGGKKLLGGVKNLFIRKWKTSAFS